MNHFKNKYLDTEQISDHKLWLAPLAGYSDAAFRKICKKCGVDVLVSEMVSADGMIYNPKATLPYAEFSEDERPFGIQLFGSDPSIMQKAAVQIAELQPDFIDINMGCPVKKVVKRGAGSALMKNPEVACEIVKKLKQVIEHIPISVKFRSGWNNKKINAIDFGKMLEQAGADVLCLHPRTKQQMFSGKSDWQLIAQLVKNVKIPVIGNGDVTTKQEIHRMYDITNCDSVMIGRGALGKPWIFSELKENREWSNEQKIELIKEHFNLTIQLKSEKKAIIEMRSHFHYYTKGMRGGAKVREYINHCYAPDKIIGSLEELYSRNYE